MMKIIYIYSGLLITKYTITKNLQELNEEREVSDFLKQ